MITLERLKQALAGVAPPSELERAAQALASAIEEAIEAEVERRVSYQFKQSSSLF